MVQQFKLLVSEEGKLIEKVIKETDTDPSVLHKSLEEFRLLVNAAITKLIEKRENGDIDGCNDEDTSSENDEETVCSNPKRRKKKNLI